MKPGGRTVGKQSSEGSGCLLFTVGALLFVFLVVVPSVVVVPVGSLGVVSVLGTIQQTPLSNGLHFVLPHISQVSIMSTRLKALHFADNVPTQEGVNVHLAASCINRLDPKMAVELYKTVGTDFETKILLPEFQSVVRAVTSGHSSQALYSSEARLTMSRDLRDGIDQLVSKRGIIVEMALISKLLLPSKIEFAIEKKMATEQEAEQMEYVLQKEKLIAEQQVVRAQGIAEFQHIISEGLTDRLLEWKAIEVTKDLANTCNPKLIVIGKGTPLMLNQDAAGHVQFPNLTKAHLD